MNSPSPAEKYQVLPCQKDKGIYFRNGQPLLGFVNGLLFPTQIPFSFRMLVFLLLFDYLNWLWFFLDILSCSLLFTSHPFTFKGESQVRLQLPVNDTFIGKSWIADM